MYSPLARYMMELGLVQRVAVASADGRTGAGDRLLSRYCISQASGHGNTTGLTLGGASTSPWECEESDVDYRTGRRVSHAAGGTGAS